MLPHPPTPFWVVLSSANGSTNLGDEAMWEASVLALRSLVGDLPVVTDGHPSFRPQLADVHVRPYLHLGLRRGSFLGAHHLERIVSYPRRNSHAVRRARQIVDGRRDPNPLAAGWRETIQSAQGVIISGAGAMTDDFAPHGIVSWWLVSRWAAEAGIPVILLGQGIGPIVDPTLQELVAEVLRTATVVNVREDRSASLVAQLAPNSQPVVTPDWAILDVPTGADRRSAQEYAEAASGGRPFVALSAHRRHNTRRGDLRELSRVLLGVTERCHDEGRAVLFVPNMTGTAYSDDRSTFDLVARTWPDALRRWVHVVREPLGPRVTRALLGHADLIATTRYHPLVFALSEGTPALGLSYDAYYDQKLSGASALFDVDDNVRRVREADARWVLETAPSLARPRPPAASANHEILVRALDRPSITLQDRQ